MQALKFYENTQVDHSVCIQFNLIKNEKYNLLIELIYIYIYLFFVYRNQSSVF